MLVGIILGCMYGLLLLYLTAQVFTLLRERHKKMSFKFGFNILCFVWNLLRVVFWVLVAVPNSTVPPFWLYFMWWLPHAVMYATFALLALFFVKLLTVESWNARWKRPVLATYGATVCIDGAVTLMWIFMAATATNSEVGDDDDSVVRVSLDESFTTASVFFLLGVLFLTFAVRLFSVQQYEANRLFVLEPKVSAAINLTLFIVFMSRSVFNFVAAMGWVVVYVTSDSMTDILVTVIMYTFWELFPTVLLLLTIARGKRGTTATREPTFGKFGVDYIAESPKLNPSAAERLRAGLLRGVPEDHRDDSDPFDQRGHSLPRTRRGSVGDAIIQGDARYGAFQGNIFGLSPAWYASSGPGRGDGAGHAHGFSSSGQFGSSAGVHQYGGDNYAAHPSQWRDSGYGSSFGTSPPAGYSRRMFATSPPSEQRRPPREAAAATATRNGRPQSRGRYNSSGRDASHEENGVQPTPDAQAARYLATSNSLRARGESVLSESGAAETNVFANRDRYDTPPTHDGEHMNRWQQLPAVGDEWGSGGRRDSRHQVA